MSAGCAKRKSIRDSWAIAFRHLGNAVAFCFVAEGNIYHRLELRQANNGS
jgi:hypothetical protein